MASTRNPSRRASPGAPGSRIPVLRKTNRRLSPRRKMTTASSNTRVLRSSIGRTPNGSNKENIPPNRRPGFLSRANLLSPSHRRRDGADKKPSGKPSKSQRAKREPLRELTEAEIFERDEAVMGDLRRRRASGENYIVDGFGDVVIFDSTLAQETAPPPEIVESSSAEAAEETFPLEAESPLVVFKPKIEKFKVLVLDDSEERLKADVDTIIAAASNASVNSVKRPRTRAALAQRQQHPAVRNSLASIENLSPELMLRSAETSPIKPLRARATRQSSPCSGTVVYAGISKVQPSPSPLKVSRVGLGAKSANTAYVMKKVLEEGGKLPDKGKVVLKDTTTVPKVATKKKTVTTTTSTASASTTGKEPKVTARRANSSLKRAAGVTGSSSARAGLAGISRMR